MNNFSLFAYFEIRKSGLFSGLKYLQVSIMYLCIYSTRCKYEWSFKTRIIFLQDSQHLKF